jgi:predicted DNA-binding transcriptional regulator YafY
LYITHDFIMELLSYGSRLKVISPEALKRELAENYSRALRLYDPAKK